MDNYEKIARLRDFESSVMTGVISGEIPSLRIGLDQTAREAHETRNKLRKTKGRGKPDMARRMGGLRMVIEDAQEIIESRRLHHSREVLEALRAR